MSPWFLQVTAAPVEHDLVLMYGLGSVVILFLFWFLWLNLHPLLDCLGVSQTAARYIKSNCRLCGGPIEFPAYGLGEKIDCPHCQKAIRLTKMPVRSRLRNWLHSWSFNWKWAVVVVGMMLSGTALFIYTDWKAQLKNRAKQEADLLSEQTEEMQRANDIAEDDASQRRMESSRQQVFLRQRLSEQTKEMQRANDIAEDDASQRRMESLRQQVSIRLQQTFVETPSPRISTYNYEPALVAPPSPPVSTYNSHPDSLANPYGAGSPYKSDGLMNPYSQYGSPYSSKSWRNPYATDAPKLYDSQGNYRGKLSANPYDPDSTSNPYGRYGSRYSSDSINNPYGLGSPYRTEPIYVVPSK